MAKTKSENDILRQYYKLMDNPRMTDDRMERIAEVTNRYTRNIQNTKRYQDNVREMLRTERKGEVYNPIAPRKLIAGLQVSRRTYMGINGG